MRRTCLLTCMALLLALPVSAEAMDMRVKSSTQYLWFNDMLTGEDEGMLAEYVSMSLTNLNEGNTINIRGYGRATYRSSSVAGTDDLLGRLYYFTLDYRDVIRDTMDLTAGRHFVNLPAGSAVIDGATLNFRNFGPFGVTVLGGRQVIFAGDRNEITGGGDRFMGASVSTDAIKLTHLEAGYAVKTDNSDVAREIVGLSVSTYLPKRIALYGEMKYDMLSETSTELLAGIRLAPIDKLTLTGEYYESYPLFDATSIYSVFAVNQYQEMLLKAEYALNDAYRIFLSYAAEDFNDGEDADLYEAGIAARPSANVVVNASFNKRNGYGGKLSGLRINGTYTFGDSSVSAGADWDDFRRETFDDATVKKYWIGGTHRLGDLASLMVRIEDSKNVNYDNQYQGVAAVTAEF